MLTKAIIEEVLTTKVGTGGSKNTTSLLLYKYRVRMPIFHGLGTDADATPIEQLPLAVCATLPHGEQTKLHINDVVYVEIEDFDLSSIVIIGMVPVMQQPPYRGANGTSSQLALDDVQSISFDRAGTAKLPADTNIYLDTINNPYYVKSGKDYISGTELSMLKDVNAPIQPQLDRMGNSIGAFNTRFNTTASITSISAVSGAAIDSGIWTERSGFNKTGVVYEFKHTSTVGKVDVWTIRVDNVTYSFTKGDLASQCGISYVYAPINAIIRVVVSDSPLSIRYGGTEARTAEEALANLGASATVVLHMDSFTNLESSGKLKANTVYYIYDDEEEKSNN